MLTLPKKSFTCYVTFLVVFIEFENYFKNDISTWKYLN